MIVKHVVLCYVMLCYVMLYYVMLCYVMSQGSYGHEKSWKVMEFENSFSRPGKVMDFR